MHCRAYAVLLAGVCFLMAAFTAGFLVTQALAAQAALPTVTPPSGSISITVPKGAKLTRDLVRFPHDKHVSEGCATCHHVLNDNKQIYTCATDGCHDLANPTGAEKKSIRYFRNAFHVRKEASCNGCHAIRKKAKRQHGPTACKACHRK